MYFIAVLQYNIQIANYYQEYRQYSFRIVGIYLLYFQNNKILNVNFLYILRPSAPKMRMWNKS